MEASQEIKGDGNTQTITNNYNMGAMKSILVQILPELAALIVQEPSEGLNDTIVYDIEQKILYNNVVTHKKILRDYGQYGVAIRELYDVYDNQEPGFTGRVYGYLKVKYDRQVERLHSENRDKESVQVIKENSDLILRSISDDLVKELKASKDININIEELEYCAVAIVCQAFIECKVLEKPPSVN